MRHLSLIVSDACSPRRDCSPGRGRHVLVFDRAAFSSRLTKRLLTRAGFTATVVAAVCTARAFTTTFEIDAIVVGPDDFQALDLALDRSRPPIVITSAFEVDEATCERAEERGAFTVALAGDVVDAVLEALWEHPG